MSKINSSLGHLVFLIHEFDKNIGIYRKLFEYLEYPFIVDENYGIGVNTPQNASIWIMRTSKENLNNRDANGLNHIAFNVTSKEDVDIFTKEFLVPNNIELLFDTPKARPDFTGDTGIYYQVMFELPGSLLIEVVYNKFD